MERIFENYLNDIYVDVLNFIEDTNLNIKFLRFYRKKPNLLVCELFDENQESPNQFRHINIVYSMSAMYQYLSVYKKLISREDIPLTANEIDRNSDFYESSVAMTLLCSVVDKLTGPANEALEYMLEISNHSYMSSYMNINDISPINFKRIAEIEDMDVKQFENAITTNTVTIEICKEKTKISVKLNKRMEEYSDCDLSDNLKVRILIGIIRAKYFMEEGGTDEFDCIYYHQSNVMDFPNSIHL